MSYCQWSQINEAEKNYHDTRWGFPLHDDTLLFEYLCLECFQCGLSWDTILQKKDIMEHCFDNFDITKVANYSQDDIERIMAVPGMIKSPQKIKAMIHNAQCVLRIIDDYGTFDNYIWSYSDYKTIVYDKHADGYIPVSNYLSEKVSKDLKKKGLKYIGSVVIYSFLQACGIINDHGRDCPCYQIIVDNYPVVYKRRYMEKNITFFGEKK